MRPILDRLGQRLFIVLAPRIVGTSTDTTWLGRGPARGARGHVVLLSFDVQRPTSALRSPHEA
jgi:hypothetical protein